MQTKPVNFNPGGFLSTLTYVFITITFHPVKYLQQLTQCGYTKMVKQKFNIFNIQNLGKHKLE